MYSPTKLTPDTDISTAFSAINKNFEKLQEDSVTRVVKDNDGKSRVLIGKRQDGSYGVDVSLSGHNVVGAKPSELAMSSDFNMYKIIREGYIEPVPRAGNVTLSGNYIGYSLILNIEIDRFKEDFFPYAGSFSNRVMTNVCYDHNKESVVRSGLFWWEDGNRAFFANSVEMIPNTNILSIQFNVRAIGGTVTFTPRNLFSDRIYWQISNPTRDGIYGRGGDQTSQGKYIYQDIITFNEDGTVKRPLRSVTRLLRNYDPPWQMFPYRRPLVGATD